MPVISAPVSATETERLAALLEYDVLDSAPEPAFDELTRLAADICDVPICLVCFVDADRQWFKSHVGIDTEQTPREVAFCAYTILQQDIFEIPNALEDPRFAANPLVTADPHICFYAGAPLISPKGYALGTLCVIDRVPRRLTPVQRKALQTLSRQVVAQLELRHKLHEVQQANTYLAERAAGDEKFRVLFEHSSDAHILFDENGIFDCNNAALAMLRCSNKSEVLKLQPAALSPEFQPDGRRSTEKWLEIEALAWKHGHHRFEWLRQALDGIEFLVEVSLTPVPLDERQVLLSVCHDLTNRKVAETKLKESQESYALAVQGSQDGVWDWNIRTGNVYFSPRWKSMIGYEEQELPNHIDTWRDNIHPEDKDRVQEVLQNYFGKPDSIYEVEFRLRCKDNSYRWILARGAALWDAEGKPYRMAGSHTDVTARRAAEQELVESRHFSQSIAEASPNILYVYDLLENRNVYSNREINAFLGYSPEAMRDMGANILPTLIHHEDLPLLAVYHAEFATAADGEIREIEYQMRHADGTWRWMHSRDTVFNRTPEGKPRQILGSAQDVTAQKNYEQQIKAQMAQVNEANAKLHALANTDGLTGLTNHRAFQERLVGMFEEHTEQKNRQLSVLLLDVDRFKQFNDTFGHPAGDGVLKQVAQILQVQAGPANLVARYGGEEFVVVLPADADEAIETADRLRKAVAAGGWKDRAITVSVGVSTLRADISEPSLLIAEADKALYKSKQQGRNCVSHAQDFEDDDLTGEIEATPYADLIMTVLESQQGTLFSATNDMKETMWESYDATIQSWSRLLDMRDKETEGHSERVTEMTVMLARSIGMNEEETLYLRWGALLHDIGKMGVPDHILLKPGSLTDEEWVVMRRHPDIAYNMLSSITFLRPALDIPYCHHEKWDGTGYPRGLKGDEIPLAARLFAVIDVYDALRSDRPYRQGWPEQKVRDYLQQQSGAHFDPLAVRAFLRVLEQKQRAVKKAA